jgi:hypothetical protein
MHSSHMHPSDKTGIARNNVSYGREPNRRGVSGVHADGYSDLTDEVIYRMERSRGQQDHQQHNKTIIKAGPNDRNMARYKDQSANEIRRQSSKSNRSGDPLLHQQMMKYVEERMGRKDNEEANGNRRRNQFQSGGEDRDRGNIKVDTRRQHASQSQHHDNRIRSPLAMYHGSHYKESYALPNRSRVPSFTEDDDGVSSIGFSPGGGDDDSYMLRVNNNSTNAVDGEKHYDGNGAEYIDDDKELFNGRGNKDIQQLNFIGDVRSAMQSPRDISDPPAYMTPVIRRPLPAAPSHSQQHVLADELKRPASTERVEKLRAPTQMPTVAATNGLSLPKQSDMDKVISENINTAAEWSRLLSWLIDIKMEKYAPNFRRGAITQLSVVELLQEQDLELLNIADEDRQIILNRIGEFSSRTRSFAKLAMSFDVGNTSPSPPRTSTRKRTQSTGSAVSKGYNAEKAVGEEPTLHSQRSTASSESLIYEASNEALKAMASDVLIGRLLEAFDESNYDNFQMCWTEAVKRLPAEFVELKGPYGSKGTAAFSGYTALQSLHFNMQLHFAVEPIRRNNTVGEVTLAMDRFRKILDELTRSERNVALSDVQVPASPGTGRMNSFTSTREFALYAGIVFSADPASNPLYAPIFDPSRSIALRNKCELFFQLTGLAHDTMDQNGVSQSALKVSMLPHKKSLSHDLQKNVDCAQIVHAETPPPPNTEPAIRPTDGQAIPAEVNKDTLPPGIRKPLAAKLSLKDIIRRPSNPAERDPDPEVAVDNTINPAAELTSSGTYKVPAASIILAESDQSQLHSQSPRMRPPLPKVPPPLIHPNELDHEGNVKTAISDSTLLASHSRKENVNGLQAPTTPSHETAVVAAKPAPEAGSGLKLLRRRQANELGATVVSSAVPSIAQRTPTIQQHVSAGSPVSPPKPFVLTPASQNPLYSPRKQVQNTVSSEPRHPSKEVASPHGPAVQNGGPMVTGIGSVVSTETPQRLLGVQRRKLAAAALTKENLTASSSQAASHVEEKRKPNDFNASLFGEGVAGSDGRLLLTAKIPTGTDQDRPQNGYLLGDSAVSPAEAGWMFCTSDGSTAGPLDLDTIAERVLFEMDLSKSTHVWKKGMKNWEQIRNVSVIQCGSWMV